jgi:Co/Zn/Cd efflux system component
VSASCCSNGPDRDDELARGLERRSLRRILWIALAINAGMFALEVAAGAHARSSSLQADALDFLADAANYAISLFVAAATLRRRATAALVKGASMGLFGLWVLGQTGYHALTGTVPRAEVMGVVGALALVANVAVLALLVSFRRGDSNMRSVWICSRNDVVGNVAVLVAASGVIATKNGWPDVIVAIGMAALALWGAMQIVLQAVGELRAVAQPSQDQVLNRRSHANLV